MTVCVNIWGYVILESNCQYREGTLPRSQYMTLILQRHLECIPVSNWSQQKPLDIGSSTNSQVLDHAGGKQCLKLHLEATSAACRGYTKVCTLWSMPSYFGPCVDSEWPSRVTPYRIYCNSELFKVWMESLPIISRLKLLLLRLLFLISIKVVLAYLWNWHSGANLLQSGTCVP